jgi:L-lactate dehydrogenase
MMTLSLAGALVLIDLNAKLAHAQAEDILHATPFVATSRIIAGDYTDLEGSQIVILTCGVGQRPGETRLRFFERNAAVFEAAIPQVMRYAPETVLLILQSCGCDHADGEPDCRGSFPTHHRLRYDSGHSPFPNLAR